MLNNTQQLLLPPEVAEGGRGVSNKSCCVLLLVNKRPAGPEKDGMMMNCWYDVMTIVVDVERSVSGVRQ